MATRRSSTTSTRARTAAPASPAQRALEWVCESLRDDPTVVEDQARRALALGSFDAPCPHDEKRTVLFLCTGNACRSQMAEALLRFHAGDRFQVYSAGLEPRRIPDLTLSVMRERGLDLEEHRKRLESEGRSIDYFVAAGIILVSGAALLGLLAWIGKRRRG